MTRATSMHCYFSKLALTAQGSLCQTIRPCRHFIMLAKKNQDKIWKRKYEKWCAKGLGQLFKLDEAFFRLGVEFSLKNNVNFCKNILTQTYKNAKI